MTKDEVLDRMRNLYVAQTGLGRLPDWETDRAIAPNGMKTVRNENGILYRMLAVIQAHRAGAKLSRDDEDILARAVVLLRCDPDKAGLYNRQPHGQVPPTRSEAHDNYIGICLADWYFGLTEEAEGMIYHWWHNWFCFDNVKPGRFSFQQFRQPGEVAIYYVAAKRRAPFFFMLWFLAGVLINAVKVKDGEPSRLTFMRLFLVEQVGVKGFVQRFLFNKVKSYWYKKLKEKFGGDGISPIMLEYKAGHPIYEFQKIIDAEVK